MDPEALAFIDNVDTQKLVITWPKVTLHAEPTDDLKQFPDRDVWFSVSEWAAKSGVAKHCVTNALHVLAAHGVISPDGTVPKIAVAYIRKCIGKRIK